MITLAMRGDGDEPMSEDANISLLQNIVKDQRKIIEKVTGKKAKETPQVWALYKEVQDYYDKGNYLRHLRLAALRAHKIARARKSAGRLSDCGRNER